MVNGVAKLYGMTGFRIGWVVAPRDLVRVMTNVLAQTTSCVSPRGQAAAEGALNGLQSVVEALRLQIQNNRDVAAAGNEVLQRRAPDPAAGNVLCPAGYPGLQQQLGGSLQVPAQESPGRDGARQGIRHGRPHPPVVRGSVKDVTEGIARIKWALDPTSPNEIYIVAIRKHDHGIWM